ncbi:nucleotidyltransferase substrate binding protein [Caldicellulosiruptoraceae bacterium PP1]
MNTERLKERLNDYNKAVIRLKEALEENQANPLIYDAVIQRFEFTYELAWKLMKAYLEYIGITNVNSPRSAFKEAFSSGLILDGDIWIEMINARNLTSHTYDEELAKEIYNLIKQKFYNSFSTFLDRMVEMLK